MSIANTRSGLLALGWSEFFERFYQQHESAEPGFLPRPARVVQEERGLYRVAVGADRDAGEEFWAESRGAGFEPGQPRDKFPAVGDWVLCVPPPANDREARARITAVLERRTCLQRQAPEDRGGVQIMAANIDFVLVVTSFNDDFNLARLERYLAVVGESGATPVVVLNKADLVEPADRIAFRDAVTSIAPAVAVVELSAKRGDGMDSVRPYFTEGRTGVLVGSSGVGKSTLMNALLGDRVAKTQDIREDDARGRHTTTSRRLYVLRDTGSGTGLLIDTPGIRSLAPGADVESVERVFADVAALLGRCRFSDCQHASEPGCLIKESLASGALDRRRWENYLKLEAEAAFQLRRGDKAAESAARGKWKKIGQAGRERVKIKKSGRDF